MIGSIVNKYRIESPRRKTCKVANNRGEILDHFQVPAKTNGQMEIIDLSASHTKCYNEEWIRNRCIVETLSSEVISPISTGQSGRYEDVDSSRRMQRRKAFDFVNSQVIFKCTVGVYRPA